MFKVIYTCIGTTFVIEILLQVRPVTCVVPAVPDLDLYRFTTCLTCNLFDLDLQVTDPDHHRYTCD